MWWPLFEGTRWLFGRKFADPSDVIGVGGNVSFVYSVGAFGDDVSV